MTTRINLHAYVCELCIYLRVHVVCWGFVPGVEDVENIIYNSSQVRVHMFHPSTL